jgi:hypothetical protein
MVDMNYLKKINPINEFDPYITFDEFNHFYFVDSNTFKVSVTGFIDYFFPGFDANKTIKGMQSSRTWKTNPKYKQYQGLTVKEIKTKWKENGIQASSDGTAFHESVEKFYNHATLCHIGGTYRYFQTIFDSVTLNKVAFQQFLNWHFDMIIQKNPNWIPFRTELRVFDRSYCLAGSIDMIFELHDSNQKKSESKKLIIIDWKNSKEIKQTNNFENAKKPISNLPNCNFAKYSLQLNMYKHIIEKNTKHQVIFMALAVFHETHSNYQFYPVSFLPNEIQSMLTILKTKSIDDIYNEIQLKKTMND